MPYPHGPSCRCPSPLPADAGLLKFTVDCEHFDALSASLDAISGQQPVLRVLPTEPEPPSNLVPLPSDGPSCTGEMTCSCLRCSNERAQRVRRGVRPSSPIPLKVIRKAA